MASNCAQRLGTLLRESRVKAGLSQEDLSEISGLHRTYIGCIERGEKNVSVFNFLRIAQAIGEKPEKIISKI